LATPGSPLYMQGYQSAVTQGLSQLSAKEIDELKAAAEEYNVAGTPSELRRS
jgi:hypothetical protein